MRNLINSAAATAMCAMVAVSVAPTQAAASFVGVAGQAKIAPASPVEQVYYRHYWHRHYYHPHYSYWRHHHYAHWRHRYYHRYYGYYPYYYNPAAAAAAQANANMQNDAMIASAVETGQRNMETLERFVLKDNTIMPGEWVGGQVHISPPSTMNGQSKNYVISVSFAGDVHQIEVVQQRGQ